jgi:hypothetical protein
MSKTTPAAVPNTALVDPLTAEEHDALAVCEAAIEEHIGAWVNVTNALLEIHSHRLYRETHPTFESYLKNRWGVTRSYGHRLVLMGRVRMSPIGDKIRNEAQARQVAGLLDNPDLLTAVVRRAEELQSGRPLTAKALRQARTELLVPEDQRDDARAIYRQAEAAEAAAQEVDDYCQWLAGKLLAIPPQVWGEVFDRWAAEHEMPAAASPGAALQHHLKLMVFDATLTDEVCQVLSLAEKHSQVTPAVQILSNLVRASRSMQRTWGLSSGPLGRIPAFRSGADHVQRASGMVSSLVADRLALLVIRKAEASALDERDWSAEEIEAARRQAVSGGTRPTVYGPLHWMVREYARGMGSLAEVLRSAANLVVLGDSQDRDENDGD